MRHSNGSVLVGLNNRLVKGEFPNTARTVAETEIPMEEIAQAFSTSELAWMLNYLLESSKNLTKIDYSKIKLAPICRTALTNARTVALHLEHNREYLLTHFNEIELEQGIAFLKKIEAIC